MKNQKLVIKVMTTAALLSALALPVSAVTTLSDIDGSYAKNAIQELVEKGIINGKGDGKFDPTGKIERQDFAIILAKALNLDTQSVPPTATFSDVPEPHYAFAYIEAAVKAGLINGVGDGKFGTGANLSRQDMAVLFVRALGVDATGKGAELKFSDASKIADYAKDAVAAAVELGLISGNTNGTFNPSGNAERQAVAQVAAKFIKKAEELKNQATPPSEETGTGSATTQPQTPAPTTPPANTGNSGGGSSSGGGSNSGGGSTNPGTPVETELAQPTLSFSNGRTIVMTYNETLDERYKPTPENFRLTKASEVEEQDSTVYIKSIHIQGKSVLIETTSILRLGESVNLSYNIQPSEQAIRSTSGKLSPAVTNKTITYQEDPAAYLSKLIEEAEQLLLTAEPGVLVGNYPQDEIDLLQEAIDSAKIIRDSSEALPESIVMAIYSLENARANLLDAQVKPLMLSLAENASFVMNRQLMEGAISIENGPPIEQYNKRNINNLIKIQRADQDQELYVNIVPNDSEEHDFKVIMDDQRVGYIDIESSDSEIQIDKTSEGVNISLPAEYDNEEASLLFKLTDLGAPDLVQQVELPITWDEVAPTISVTESTYSDGNITLVSSEPLLGSFQDINITYNYDSSEEENSISIPLEFGNDFNVSSSLPGQSQLTIRLDDRFITEISSLPSGRFEIRIEGFTDFAKNQLIMEEPITIPVPALSHEQD